MNNINSTVLDEMKNKVESFPQQYRDFYNGKLSEEELTEHVSQPFWQSLHLTKKRLNKKSLVMDVNIRKDPKAGKINLGSSKTTSNIDSAEFKQNIILEKKIYKDKKIIYKEKDGYVGTYGTIKVHGENDTATCPRCGAMAKISTFVDGCDFCNSKFKVSDFEEKVSGFSLRKDGKKKLKKTYAKSFFSLSGMFVMFLLIATLSFGFFIITAMMEKEHQSLAANMGLIITFQSLPTIYKAVFTSLVVMGIIALIMGKRIRDVRIVENRVSREMRNRISYFSIEDFIQNLEYKLRNIHFAEKTSEIERFATVDLSKIIGRYDNVIECDLRNITFTDFSVDNQKNEFLVTVHLNLGLTTLIGKKVKVISEQLYVTLSRKMGIESRNISSLIEFTCNGCGSTIDMLNGGLCTSCGECIDYSDYDWMITGYYSNVDKSTAISHGDVVFGNKKEMEYYKKARLTINALFVTTFLIVCSIVLIQNKDIFYVYSISTQLNEICEKEFEDVKKLDEIKTDYLTEIGTIDYRDEVALKTYRYSYEGDLEGHLDIYRKYLIEECGYELVPDSDGDWVLQKEGAYENDNIQASFYIKVEEKDNNEVEVGYFLDEKGLFDY